MSKKSDGLALLPNGFVDVLPPHAQSEARAIRAMMEVFGRFGYQLIKPPLLEFEDSLLAPGPGERLAPETFRLMDPASHRMLGIRSDITAQVARIASSRLAQEARPLRLMYANDVLRTRGSQIRTERQFTQIGCELIGGDGDLYTDVEVCMLAILGLKAIGITGITMDFTIPGFVRAVMAEDEITDELLKAVAQRDGDALRAMGLAKTAMIASAMEACGDAGEALGVLAKIGFKGALGEKIKHLDALYQAVDKALAEMEIEDVKLSLDVLEQAGFEYHNSFGFTLFSSNLRGEMGRGGSYDVHFGTAEKGEAAKGFTLYMDTLTRVLPDGDSGKRLMVGPEVSWGAVRDLQNEGWIVVRGDVKTAPAQGCGHVYKNSRITEI